MPKFRIGRLEVHEYPVEVEAKDMVEAMQKVMDGEGESVDVSGDTYVETDEEHGISVDQLLNEFPELNKPKILKRLRDIANSSDFVPSIRSVEQIDD